MQHNYSNTSESEYGMIGNVTCFEVFVPPHLFSLSNRLFLNKALQHIYKVGKIFVSLYVKGASLFYM